MTCPCCVCANNITDHPGCLVRRMDEGGPEVHAWIRSWSRREDTRLHDGVTPHPPAEYVVPCPGWRGGDQ